MSKELRLDDILVTGQKYKIWDEHIAIYRFKDKRTFVFELPDGSLTKFTGLKIDGVKHLNGQIPKVVESPKVNYSVIYKPVNTGDFMKDWEINNENLRKIDERVKTEGGLVGRYIQEPYADSYAIYQIVSEKGSKVKIKAITGIGDDWVLPVWGRETMIDKSYAQSSVYRRDRLRAFFIGKN